MASATGIPDGIPDTAPHRDEEGRGEDEPLLGRRGDASQPEGKALYHNAYSGKIYSTTFHFPRRLTNLPRHRHHRPSWDFPSDSLCLGQCLFEQASTLRLSPSSSKLGRNIIHSPGNFNRSAHAHTPAKATRHNCPLHTQQSRHRCPHSRPRHHRI